MKSTLHKFYVLCALSVHSLNTTCLPVMARDAKHAVKIAKGQGLFPHYVVAGK